MKENEIKKLIEDEVSGNPALQGKQGNQGNRGLQGIPTPFLDIIRTNLPIILLLVSIIVGWVTMSTEIQGIHAQQDINTSAIGITKDVEQQILITLERIQTNQANDSKKLDDIQTKLDEHVQR